MKSFSTVLSVSILFTSLFIACKKNAAEPNLPPLSFTVTATVTSTGNDVVLSWTKAKDPNNDQVSYSVIYHDTLVKKLLDTTFTIRNVPFNATIAGTVVATDPYKATSSAVFIVSTKENPYVAIPDVAFEKALLQQGIDDIIDGKLLKTRAAKVDSLEVPFKGISSLQGIEAFVNLYNLVCVNNQLTSLDVSNNPLLMYMYCDNNQLTKIDISNNVNLRQFQCNANRLTTIDVSKNTLLEAFYCENNQLTALDVRNNKRLVSFSSTGNKIETICVASLPIVGVNWSKDPSTTYKVCP